MARQVINRGSAPNDHTGDSAYVFTNKINQMTLELYGAIAVPILIPLTGTTTQAFNPKDYVAVISMSVGAGTPVVKIGTTVGAEDIYAETTITDFAQCKPELYYSVAGTIYFTVTGGTINVRIDLIENYV